MNDAPIQTLTQRLKDIPAGESRWFSSDEVPLVSIKTTLTRLKKDAESGCWDFDYTTRKEHGGLRVWRLT